MFAIIIEWKTWKPFIINGSITFIMSGINIESIFDIDRRVYNSARTTMFRKGVTDIIDAIRIHGPEISIPNVRSTI